MRYWWVNQNQTFKHEVPGGYLWSPKTKANGLKNYFYDTMTHVRPGDLVFSYAASKIKAIGLVMGTAVSAIKPTEFEGVQNPWDAEGWMVPVRFTLLETPLTPKDHMATLAPLLPAKYAPLRGDGNGLQGVYLTEVTGPLATALKQLLDGQVEEVVTDDQSEFEGTATAHIEEVRARDEKLRTDLQTTETQLSASASQAVEPVVDVGSTTRFWPINIIGGLIARVATYLAGRQKRL